jgi:hypothetical protein
VELRYWSLAAFYGFLVSLGLLWAVTTAMIFLRASSGRIRVALGVACGCLGMVGMTLWNQSLYTGRNLETSYQWSVPHPSPTPSLAFNKRTWESSLLWPLWPHLYYGGRVVDGDVSPRSGLLTRRQKSPWWKVDLSQSYEIGSLLLYESRVGEGYNRRPLWIFFSEDGQNWSKVREILGEPQGGGIRVTWDPSARARFVMIRAGNACCLALDEVEIFPPEQTR